MLSRMLYITKSINIYILQLLQKQASQKLLRLLDIVLRLLMGFMSQFQHVQIQVKLNLKQIPESDPVKPFSQGFGLDTVLLEFESVGLQIHVLFKPNICLLG